MKAWFLGGGGEFKRNASLEKAKIIQTRVIFALMLKRVVLFCRSSVNFSAMILNFIS